MKLKGRIGRIKNQQEKVYNEKHIDNSEDK